MSETPSLSTNQLQVLALIAAGATAVAAAFQSGVHRNTVSNWLHENEFRAALEQARADKALLYQDQAEAIAAEALAALRAVIADPYASGAARVKAALAMLDHAAILAPATSATLHKNAQPDQPARPAGTVAPTIATLHKNAQSPAAGQPVHPAGRPAPTLATLHKNAQPPAPVQPVKPAPRPISTPKTGRNEPCPCGSGIKFKRCCLGKAAA